MDTNTPQPAVVTTTTSEQQRSAIASSKLLTAGCLIFCLLAHSFAITKLTIAFRSFLDHQLIAGLGQEVAFLTITVGFAISAIAYALIGHKVNRNVSLLIACLLSGVSLFLQQLFRNVDVAHYVLLAVSGITSAVIETTCISTMIEMFDQKSGPLVTVLYLVMKAGQAIGSLTLFSNMYIATGSSEPRASENDFLDQEVRDARMACKLAATGMFFATAGLAMVYGTRRWQQINRQLRDDKEDEGLEPQVVKYIAADGSIQVHNERTVTQNLLQQNYSYKLLFVALGSLVAASAVVIDASDTSFYFYIGWEGIEKAARIVHTSEVIAIVGLLVSSLVLIKVPVKWFVVPSVALLIVGNIVTLLATAPTPPSAVMLWTGRIASSVGLALIAPVTLTLLQQRVNVTARTVGLTLAAGKIFLFFPLFALRYFQTREKRTFLYFNIAAGANVAALFLVIILMGRFVKK